MVGHPHAGTRYLRYDQRIEWSGLEATFGGEGAISPILKHRFGQSQVTFEGEFFLNEPYDKNILLDTLERRSYLATLQPDTFEISKLLIRWEYEDFAVVLGKMDTPFGRTYYPLYTNSLFDAPFIRTECILERETGLLLHYHPGHFVGDIAVTNGGQDCDANSSKALMGRIGLEDEKNWAVGASAKWQDGIGSEGQKEYCNYVGADAMCRVGPWTLSSEVIYDQYGFTHPGFNPDDIFWGRSIYFRDEYNVNGGPLAGIGYYVNLGYEFERWNVMLNYGEFYPTESSGDPRQSVINRRGIVKVAYAFSPHFKTYNMLMSETAGYIAQDGRPRRATWCSPGWNSASDLDLKPFFAKLGVW